MQVFGGAVSTPVWGEWGGTGSELVPQGSGRATLFASSDSFSIRRTVEPQYIRYRQHTDRRQTDRRTDTTLCHKRDSYYGRPKTVRYTLTIDFHCIVHVHQLIPGHTRRRESPTSSALLAAIDPWILFQFLPQKNTGVRELRPNLFRQITEIVLSAVFWRSW